MAVVNQQVESFVQKFRELWASGLSAHLDLDCGGGEAWVGLRLRLGRHRVGGAQRADRDDRHRRGASYARRLERRAAARTAAAQATSVAPGQAEQASLVPAPAVEASAPVHAEQAVEVPAQDVGEGEGQVRAEEAEKGVTEEVVSGEDSETDDDDSVDKTVEESEHKCHDCGFLVFPRVSSLREHEHCEVAWDCDVCDKGDMTVSEITAHIKDKHKGVAWISDSESEIELSEVADNKDNA